MTMTATWFRPRAAGGTTLILLTMSLGVLIAQIDTSVVNLAVKQIGASLDAGVSVLQWVVDAYNLVYASLLLTAGSLADIYGRRRIFALGIVLFTAGSLVCGLAPNATVLVTAAAIAGLGAALEIPTSLAILAVAYPDTRERTRGAGIVGELQRPCVHYRPDARRRTGRRRRMAQHIFCLIIPMCILALALTATAVPESNDPKGRSLDVPGQVLAIAALGALSVGVIEGPRWGWESSPASCRSPIAHRGRRAVLCVRQARSGRRADAAVDAQGNACSRQASASPRP